MVRHQSFSIAARRRRNRRSRETLERLARYGARPAFAHDRITWTSDDRISYKPKRPWPGGRTHLVSEPVAFLRRVIGIIPPPRRHLVRYAGVFGPASKARPKLRVLCPPPPPTTPLTQAAPRPNRPPPTDRGAFEVLRARGADLAATTDAGATLWTQVNGTNDRDWIDALRSIAPLGTKPLDWAWDAGGSGPHLFFSITTPGSTGPVLARLGEELATENYAEDATGIAIIRYWGGGASHDQEIRTFLAAHRDVAWRSRTAARATRRA